MVLVQKWPFFQLFFLGNIGQENVFYDILERKNVFLSYKNKKSKKSKNWHFSRGTHGFGPKRAIFWTFCFRQYRPEKCLLRYSRVEKRLSSLWKQEVQKVKKINIFLKWFQTHGFGPKMAIFSFFFLGNIGQKKFFYDILEWKNAFLGYKNKKFKKWKNWHFFNGVNPWFCSENCHFSKFLFFRKYRPEKCLLWYFRAKKRLSSP